jgi:hypothetical protein
MNNASSNNNSRSATPLPSALEGPQSEGAFLEGQANQAVAAMQQTVQGMQESVKEVLDIHWWTEHRPWLTVGAVALGGFAAASLLPKAGKTPEREKEESKSSLLSSLVVFGLGAVRGAAVSALTSAITSALVVDQKVEEKVEEAQDESLGQIPGMR